MIEGGYTTQYIGASDHPFWNLPQPTSIMEGNTAHMCISLHKNACAPWEELLDHRAERWVIALKFQACSSIYQRLRCWAVTESILEILKYWNWTKSPQSHSHIQLQSWPWSTFFVIQVAIPCHSQFSTTGCHWSPTWWGEIPGWRALFVLGGVLSALVALVIGIFMANASASSTPHRTRFIDFWVFHWDLQMQTSGSHNSQFSDGKVESRFCVGKSSWYFLYLFVFPTLLSLSLSLSACVGWDINISCRELWKKNYGIILYSITI